MDCANRNKDEETAKTVVEALSRCSGVLGPGGIESFNVGRFKVVFQEAGDLLKEMEGVAIREVERNVGGGDENDQESESGSASASAAEARSVGVVARLVPGTKFGFIRDDQGAEVFFHRGELQVDRDWLDEAGKEGELSNR